MAATAFIFDLDGTIWDSFPWYAEILETEAGVAAESTLSALQRNANVVALIERVGISRSRFSRHVEAHIEGLKLYSGMRQVLESLATRGLPLGVVTSLPSWIAVPTLTSLKLDELFVEIIHAGSGLARKPRPEGIHRVLESAGIDPTDDVFYIGDRMVDSKTAQNAGISFAWAAYGYEGTRPEFVTIQVDQATQLLGL